MKMQIHKLQVTQYGHSEHDNTDSKSQFSINSNVKSASNQFTGITQDISNRIKPPSSGF